MAFYSAVLVLVLFLSLFIILLVAGRMNMRGALPMLHLFFGVFVWVLCQLLHIYVIDPQWKYFWYEAKFAGIAMLAPSFTLLAIDMSDSGLAKSWRSRGLVAYVGVVLAMVATDPWTHFFRQRIAYVVVAPFVLVRTDDALGFWLFTAASYGMILTSLVLLGRRAWQSLGRERNQALLLFMGCLLPWVCNMAFVAAFSPNAAVDYTPAFMLITEAVFLFTLFHYRMFNIVPFTKRAVFDNIDDLILVVDAGERIQDMNPAARRVYGAAVRRGGIAVEDFMVRMSPPFKGSVRGIRGEFQAEWLGHTRDYLAGVKAIYGAQGACIGHLLAFHDITEDADSRRKLELATNEVALQNEKKLLFVKQVNRKIRMPMNRVLGFAEVFAAKALDESQREAVEHLTLSGRHLIQLINDITDYSRIETGNMRISEEPVQLYDLVRHVCRLYEYPAGQKGILVKYSVASDVPVTLMADPLRLTQVFSNLVGNAVKFTDRGQVSLSVRQESEGPVEITVEDTGIGISEEELQDIFKPYQQAEGGKMVKVGGTGLGLAIVKDLVERMKGTVSVKSQPGFGTAFTLRLPLRESHMKSPVYSSERIAEYRTRTRHVGLAVRDSVQQTLIRRFFRAWPQVICHDVSEEESGTGEDIPWDILLVNLEEFSAEAIRSRFPAPAIVGITNDTETLERERQTRRLLDDCILMPFSFEVLNTAMRKAILTRE